MKHQTDGSLKNTGSSQGSIGNFDSEVSVVNGPVGPYINSTAFLVADYFLGEEILATGFPCSEESRRQVVIMTSGT